MKSVYFFRGSSLRDDLIQACLFKFVSALTSHLLCLHGVNQKAVLSGGGFSPKARTLSGPDTRKLKQLQRQGCLIPLLPRVFLVYLSCLPRAAAASTST